MCSDRIRRRAVSSLFTWLLMVKLHLDDYSGGKVRAPLDLRCTSVYHPQLLPVPCTSLRQLQSPSRYRRLSRNPLAPGIILYQGSATTSPSCESPSLIAAE